MRAWIAVFFVAFTLPSAAQTYESMLLPIAFRGEVPGAYGTRWTTSTIVFNDGPEPVEYLVPLGPPQTLNPGASAFVTLPEPWDCQCALLAVTQASNVRIASLLRDVARSEENAGTELPVVRVQEFSNRIVLPMVLLRGPWRTALRIYGFSFPEPVRIRLYRLDRAEPLVDELLPMYSHAPSYHHEFDLIARWPQLEAAASVRVELESATKIWAFASQTNNVTQLVTTVRPQ